MRLIHDNVYRVSLLNECKRLKIELKEAIECEDEVLILAIQNQLSAFELAIKLIDIQPTAYDIDKVVEELEKEQFMIPPLNPNHYADHVLYLEDAIEIVKAGGVKC